MRHSCSNTHTHTIVSYHTHAFIPLILPSVSWTVCKKAIWPLTTRGHAYFLTGVVFCRFHILSVWSSEAVMRTGSVGWNARPRMASKWLRRENFGFHVLRRASLLLAIWQQREGGRKRRNPHYLSCYWETVMLLCPEDSSLADVPHQTVKDKKINMSFVNKLKVITIIVDKSLW